MAQWLSDRMGQPFVVENRPGAGGNIGTEMALRAAPDGYTLLLIQAGNVINTSLYNNLSFNFPRDAAPVVVISRPPFMMSVHPSASGQNGPGVHRIRERQSWKGQYGVGGDRHGQSCRR